MRFWGEGGVGAVQTTKRKSDWDFRVMYSWSLSMVKRIRGYLDVVDWSAEWVEMSRTQA